MNKSKNDTRLAELEKGIQKMIDYRLRNSQTNYSLAQSRDGIFNSGAFQLNNFRGKTRYASFGGGRGRGRGRGGGNIVGR